MADLLVRDTTIPNKDPFVISEEGYKGLDKKYPGRYKPVGGQVKVLPGDIVIVPSIQHLEGEPKKAKGKVKDNSKPL